MQAHLRQDDIQAGQYDDHQRRVKIEVVTSPCGRKF